MSAHVTLLSSGFYRLWVGDFVSNTGTAMMMFAIPVIGITLMDLNALEVSYVVAAGLSAPLVVSLSAGVIADHINRTTLLHACNVGRFVVVALTFTLLLAGWLTWPVLAVGLFSVGAMTLLYESSMAAAVPALVPKPLLVRANSWIEGGLSVTESAGPALSGLLISVLAAPFVIAANGLTYLFSSFMLLRLPLNSETDRGMRADAPSRPLRDHLRDIRLGFALIWRQPLQRTVLVAAAIYNFFDSWILAIFAVYALSELGFSVTLLGLVFVLPVVVGILTSIAAERIIQHFGLGPTIVLSFCVIAAAGLCLPVAAAFRGVGAGVVASIVFAVFEACIVVNMIIGRTMRQVLMPRQHLSKVSGTARFVSWGVDPFGAIAGGLVATVLGIYGSVIIGSAGFILAALVCVFSRPLWLFRALPPEPGTLHTEPTSVEELS